jgi:histidine ammonia-lyase
MSETYNIQEKLDFATLEDIMYHRVDVQLSEVAKTNILKSRKFLDNYLENNDKPVYGINTGFGALYSVKIPKESLSTLQEKLILSHACGIGDTVPEEIVRLMLALKIQGLSYGNSGVKLDTVDRLIYFLNNEIHPVVYEQGSLGASGDLAPLAHLSLPLIGRGEVNYKGRTISTHELYKSLNLSPIDLASKEGLALLNGTQFMSSYASYIVIKMKNLLAWADIVGALSLDAFYGLSDPFYEGLHLVRPHLGQKNTAKNMLLLLEGSEIQQISKEQVQDPYSFRCIPQVHGAIKDTYRYFRDVINTEIQSATDNPTIFPDEGKILSGGNFHGEPLAFVLDFIGIALSELANISERRIYQLISGKRKLPSFLVANPGLNSGFMIPQYTAAAIVSQCKQLATPSSVDSIESSQGQEDHVSMGANAATKALRIYNNVERVIAIELLNAAQALEFRHPHKTSPILEKVLSAYRENVAFINEDSLMHDYISKSVDFIKNNKYSEIIECELEI